MALEKKPVSKQQFYTKFIYNVCNNSKTFFSDTTVTSHFQYTYAIVRFVGTQANLKMGSPFHQLKAKGSGTQN